MHFKSLHFHFTLQRGLSAIAELLVYISCVQNDKCRFSGTTVTFAGAVCNLVVSLSLSLSLNISYFGFRHMICIVLFYLCHCCVVCCVVVCSLPSYILSYSRLEVKQFYVIMTVLPLMVICCLTVHALCGMMCHRSQILEDTFGFIIFNS